MCKLSGTRWLSWKQNGTRIHAVNDSFSYMVKNENNVIHSTRCDISSDLTPGAQFLKNYNINHELIWTFRNYAFIK